MTCMTGLSSCAVAGHLRLAFFNMRQPCLRLAAYSAPWKYIVKPDDTLEVRPAVCGQVTWQSLAPDYACKCKFY